MKYVISESQQENLIFNYLEKYIESGCVTIKKTSNHISVDVESAGYFEDYGFDKSDVSRIKNMLKKNNFQYSFGDYIKRI